MKRPVMIALVATIALLIGTTAVFFQKYQKTTADFTDMKAAEETARSHYADAFNAIAEIQDSLNAISVDEGNVKLLPQSLQAEQKLSAPNRREVLESIAQLNASIQRTKDRINTLESSLTKSGLKVAGLQRMITVLKHTMADKQVQVAELTTRVDSLQTTVAGLQTTVQEAQDTILAKQQMIADKERELGTIYYIVGTRKELTASGILVAKGGILGLGKTMQMSTNFDESRFTALNTDEESTVRAQGLRVQVISPQPASSYELRVEGNQVELHILDPKEFRKIKHLVIMTA